MSEETLTTSLVNILFNGGLNKLSRINKQRANIYREVGHNGCIADIFVTLENHSAKDTKKIKSIAIEVKIKDWSSGLYQAWRYRNFAEKSYLAIYKPFAKNLDIELFQNYNVGVIIFDQNSMKIIHKPKEYSFKRETYEYSAKRNILQTLIDTE